MKRIEKGYLIKVGSEYVIKVIEPSNGHGSPSLITTPDAMQGKVWPSQVSCEGLVDYFRATVYKIDKTAIIEKV